MPLVRYRRVLILGYRGVAPRFCPPGKTSLAQQFVGCYEPTVESTYKMVVMGKDEFQLQVVDTAGQDEYTILPHSFVIGICNYVLAYSVPSLQTFRVVKTLHNKLSESWGKMQSVLSLPGKGVPGGAGSSPFPCLQCACGAGGEQGRPVPAELAQGIFTKIIEEMDQADDTYSRLTGCHLM